MKQNTGNKRIHLGIIFGTMISYCQYRIWDGIVEYAKQNDIDLTAYFGTYYISELGFLKHYETCMEAIKNDKTLDGVIIVTSSVTVGMKPDYINSYVKKIPENLKVVSLGAPLPGIPYAAVNSTDGIYTIINHIINEHGKRKIAFVKGPDNTWEAEERLCGYKKALEGHKIEYDEKLVLQGNYLEGSGAAAVTELLDNRKQTADAIVASNDAMAAGVIKELKSRGISVPGDVLVTGYDDDVTAWKTNPSITTIRQDFYKLGITGAEIICDMIGGKPVNSENFLPTVTMIRQSCGCFEGSRTKLDMDATAPDTDSLVSFTMHKAAALFHDEIPHGQINQWITRLIDIIKDSAFTKEKLQYCLYEILREYKQYSEERYVWCDVLHILIIGALNCKKEIEFTRPMMSALISAITFVQDTLHNERQALDYEANEFRMTIGWVANALVSTFDIDTLKEELCKLLPRLYIETALICLYRDPVQSNDPDAGRLITTVLGYDAGNIIHTKCAENETPLSLDPCGIKGFDFGRKRRTLLFYPLFFGHEELGTALLSYDPKMPIDAYTGLRIDISTAVKGASLLSRIHALSVVDELTGLYNRRGFFQHAASRLKYINREKNPQSPVVLFLDMDKLKSVNDIYGHKEGDTAIKAFAQILKESLREADVIGRMGGDEFVVLSTVNSPGNIAQLEQRLRSRIDEYNNKKLHPYCLSASIGSAPLKAPTVGSLEEAMLKADGILYEEKEKKR